MNVTERFWSKVDKSGKCWLWTAAINNKGYGIFSYLGKPQKAHRVSYELFVGPVEGFVVDHTCHTPACVRPKHLKLVTQKQNLENRKGAQVNSKSGIRGVSWYAPTGKWKAEVCHKGKTHLFGYHERIGDAEQAAIAGRAKLFTNSQN